LALECTYPNCSFIVHRKRRQCIDPLILWLDCSCWLFSYFWVMIVGVNGWIHM
jgi:hypothetical protein